MFEVSPVAKSLRFPPSQKQRADLPSQFFSFTPLFRQIVSHRPACVAPQRRPSSLASRMPSAASALQAGTKALETSVGGWETESHTVL